MHKTSLTLGLLAFIGIIAPCGIHAATPPPNADIDTDMMAREYRETTNGPGALTKEMIESCVVLKIDMEKDAANLDNLRQELGKLNNEVKIIAHPHALYPKYIENRYIGFPKSTDIAVELKSTSNSFFGG